MPQCIFKLNTSTMAILKENTQTSVIVTVPANALVTLVVGDIAGKGFVRVHYRDQLLDMLAEDLRSRDERVREQSA